MSGKADHIAGSLIHDILSARYGVGDRLPSERDLSSRYDANRGAVREAMKKLQQMGLVEVQPGGTRVKDQQEASLDVIGHLLDEGELPDMVLVDQILVVINALMGIAAEQTVELASDAEIAHLRELVQPLLNTNIENGIEAEAESVSTDTDQAANTRAGGTADKVGQIDEQAHALARFELMQCIMLTHKNLPLQLIARTLFDQFAPQLALLKGYTNLDQDAYRVLARQLDRAFATRDLPAVRATFDAFSNLNRETMMRALNAARVELGQEAATS